MSATETSTEREGAAPSADGLADPDAPFRIASWTVEPRLNRMTDGAASRRLEPKVMRVLVCLATRPGDLVTRGELMDAAWGDVHVGEDPLNRAIAELRRIFGDQARAPRVIETIPKRGYRLLVPVERLASTGPTSRRRLRSSRWLVALAAAVLVALGGVAAVRLWAPRTLEAPPASPRVVPVTSFPGREMSPAIEPDGQRIAFVWTGPEGDNLDVWVTQRGGGTPLRLTRDPAVDQQPAWTADGAEVVFLRSARLRCEAVAVPAIGGPERRLYTCRGRHAVGVDIAPDRDELVVADRDPELATAQLVAVDLATGAWRFLTTPSASWSDELPRYSPDGSSVVFRRRLGDTATDLFRVPRAGGDAVRLTRDGKDLGGHAWTTDGRALVAASNRGGGFGLWRFDVAGGAPRRLGYDNAFLPSIGRRGLVFEKRSGDVDLARLALDAGESKPWAVSTRHDLEPAFSPDGRRVAFVSRRSGSDELWLAGAGGAGDDAVQLTFFERPTPGWLPAVEHPRFTPDGAHVMVAVQLGAGYDLHAVPVDGGPPRRLTSAAGDERAPCPSPDGRFLFYVDVDVRRLPAGGEEAGAPVRLTRHGAEAQLACPAPGTVYYRRPDEPRIRRLLLADDGTARADEPVGPPLAGPEWTVAAGRLYGFVVDSDGAHSLVGFDLAEGRRILSLPLAASRPAGGVATARGGLAVAPAGDVALYARLAGDESDVLLVEGFR